MTLDELSEAGKALQDEISNVQNYIGNPNTLGQELLGRAKNFGQSLLNGLNPFWRENLSYLVSEPPLISINGVKIDNKKHLLSFKYTNKSNRSTNNKYNFYSGGELEINLLDSDGELEYNIITGHSDKNYIPITIKFSNNGSIDMMCSNITSTYGPLSTLTFVGMGLYIGDIEKQNEAKTFENMKISDIVKQIISEQPNWVEGEVAETLPIPENGLENKTFTKTADISYLDFINSLAPLAVSANGNIGNYQVEIFQNMQNKTEVNFRPINPKEEVIRIIYFSFRDVNNAKSAQVIEYSPEMKNIVLGAFIPTFDENGNIKTLPYTIPDGAKYEYNTPSSEENNSFISIKGDPETAYGQNKMSGLALANNLYGATANITLWGYDTTIRVGSNILIMAQDGRGNIHYSSGYYKVKEYTVNFEGGKWTQELSLVRTGATLPQSMGWTYVKSAEENSTSDKKEQTEDEKIDNYNKRLEAGTQ